MFQQSILDALESMGFGAMSWGQLSDLSPQTISDTFAQHYGLLGDDDDFQDLPSGMFQAITPEMLQGASYKTYSPQIQAKGQSMVSGLYEGLGGTKAREAAGGFAGSSGFGKQQAGIKDVYGKEMTDILTSVRGQQTQGIGLVQDLIAQWHEAAQSVAGLG